MVLLNMNLQKCEYFQRFPLGVSERPSQKVADCINFNNNSLKQYYIIAEKNYRKFELDNTALETTKKVLCS